MWNAPNRDQSFTYLLGGRGIRAGSHGKGGGGNRTSPTKYKGRTREFEIKAAAQFVDAERLCG